MMIDERQLTFDHTFRHRSGPDSATHLSALRKTLRNTGKLDAVLVWQETDDGGKATARLVLLDGHYRVAAYRAEQADGKISGRGIPALLLKGDRMEAHLAALTANAKDTVPLTLTERTDAAWSLVRTYRNKLSKRRLSQASGVSERTIARMRQQFRKFLEANGTPSGSWMKDRNFPQETPWEAPTDEEREAMITALAKAIQDVLRDARTKDVEIVGDAMGRALGHRQLALVVDYLNGGDDDDDPSIWMQSDDLAALDAGDLFGIPEREPVADF